MDRFGGDAGPAKLGTTPSFGRDHALLPDYQDSSSSGAVWLSSARFASGVGVQYDTTLSFPMGSDFREH